MKNLIATLFLTLATLSAFGQGEGYLIDEQVREPGGFPRAHLGMYQLTVNGEDVAVPAVVSLGPDGLPAGGGAGGATEAKQDTGNASLSTIATNTGATTPAAYTSSATKTRPADTTGYTAGDTVSESDSAGTVWTFASIGPSAGKIMITGVSLRWDVAALPSGASTFRVHLYDASPTAANDNAAFDLPSGDRAKYLGYVDIPTAADLGATLWGQDDAVRKQVKLAAASTSLFAIVETRGAFTPGSASVYTITLQTVKLAD